MATSTAMTVDEAVEIITRIMAEVGLNPERQDTAGTEILRPRVSVVGRVPERVDYDLWKTDGCVFAEVCLDYDNATVRSVSICQSNFRPLKWGGLNEAGIRKRLLAAASEARAGVAAANEAYRVIRECGMKPNKVSRRSGGHVYEPDFAMTCGPLVVFASLPYRERGVYLWIDERETDRTPEQDFATLRALARLKRELEGAEDPAN